jgi:hypothetical protein
MHMMNSPAVDNDRVVILRGTSSNFSVQLPPHAFLEGPFTLKCAGVVMVSLEDTPPVAIHCSYGSGANIHDSSGWSNAVAFLTADWTSPPIAPLVTCPGLGDGPDRVTVQIRRVDTGDLVSTVTLCVIVLELHRE